MNSGKINIYDKVKLQATYFTTLDIYFIKTHKIFYQNIHINIISFDTFDGTVRQRDLRIFQILVQNFGD
jgi:hypothetical protein